MGEKNRRNKNWQGTNSFQWLNSFPFHNWMLYCTHSNRMNKEIKCALYCKQSLARGYSLVNVCSSIFSKCNQCNELFKENPSRPLPLLTVQKEWMSQRGKIRMFMLMKLMHSEAFAFSFGWIDYPLLQVSFLSMSSQSFSVHSIINDTTINLQAAACKHGSVAWMS